MIPHSIQNKKHIYFGKIVLYLLFVLFYTCIKMPKTPIPDILKEKETPCEIVIWSEDIDLMLVILSTAKLNWYYCFYFEYASIFKILLCLTLQRSQWYCFVLRCVSLCDVRELHCGKERLHPGQLQWYGLSPLIRVGKKLFSQYGKNMMTLYKAKTSITLHIFV